MWTQWLLKKVLKNAKFDPTQPNQALLHFFLFTHDNLFIYLFIYEFIYLYTLLRK